MLPRTKLGGTSRYSWMFLLTAMLIKSKPICLGLSELTTVCLCVVTIFGNAPCVICTAWGGWFSIKMRSPSYQGTRRVSVLFLIWNILNRSGAEAQENGVNIMAADALDLHITRSSVATILTHWGRVTHICIGKLTIIGSDNGLAPERRQAIIWTNARILLIEPLGTNFGEISIKIQIFSLKKVRLKMSSVKYCPFRLGLNVLTVLNKSQESILIIYASSVFPKIIERQIYDYVYFFFLK